MTKRLSGMRKTFLYELIRVRCPTMLRKTSSVFSLNVFILFSYYYYYLLSNMCVPACERVCVCLRLSFNVFALRMKKSC